MVAWRKFAQDARKTTLWFEVLQQREAERNKGNGGQGEDNISRLPYAAAGCCRSPALLLRAAVLTILRYHLLGNTLGT